MMTQRIKARLTVAAALLLGGLLAVAPGRASAGVVSTFDSGLDGWSVTAGETSGLNWDPGGFIYANDLLSGVWWFQAPAQFHGDFAAAYNGVLSFDLKETLTPGSTNLPNDVIVLQGGSTPTKLVATVSVPPTSWASYTIPLNESAWHVGVYNGSVATQAQMQDVLSSVSDLQIFGDWIAGSDGTALDNVALSNPNAIPEPGTLALLGVGLALALGRSRRRRRPR